MKTPVESLVKADLKSILRDSTMVLAVFGPLAILALLFFLPAIEPLIANRFHFDLFPYRLLVVCFLSMIPSMLFGMIYGFIILDERDEDIIEFISITPLGQDGYLNYKLQMPAMLSAGFFLLLIYGTDLVEINPLHTILLSALVAIEAAIGTLFLVAFSENKVEGLAFSKLMGILYIAVPMVFLWNSPWHWITAPLPPFWIAKAMIHSQNGSSLVWLDIGVGFCVHFAALLILIKAFLSRTK